MLSFSHAGAAASTAFVRPFEARILSTHGRILTIYICLLEVL
jgi:hypothetical protein